MGRIAKNRLGSKGYLFLTSCFMGLGLQPTIEAAEEISSQSDAENPQELEAPDLEFLEFLGKFETEAGEWIGPESLLSEGFQELLEASSGSDNNSNTTQNGND
jgi:hypothetical protein